MFEKTDVFLLRRGGGGGGVGSRSVCMQETDVFPLQKGFAGKKRVLFCRGGSCAKAGVILWFPFSERVTRCAGSRKRSFPGERRGIHRGASERAA